MAPEQRAWDDLRRSKEALREWPPLTRSKDALAGAAAAAVAAAAGGAPVQAARHLRRGAPRDLVAERQLPRSCACTGHADSGRWFECHG